MDIKSLKAVIIPAKFMEGVNSTKFNLYNYIRLVLTQLGVTIPTPAAAPTVNYLTGVLEQNSTDAPNVTTIYKNSLGSFSTNRVSTGVYDIDFASPLGTNNVTIMFGANQFGLNKTLYGSYNSIDNAINFYCKDDATGNYVDIAGSGIVFEIKAFM
ncbi:MAG: hypothetical protein ACK5XN_08010 [Bacteroidota bacterium]